MSRMSSKLPLKFLTEEEKMCRLVDRLRAVTFGHLKVTKRHGKITKMEFDGEDIFNIPEHAESDKEVGNAT